MTYAPRLDDAQAPQEQLYALLASYGFVPVLHESLDKREVGGLLVLHEMWRLDKPQVRAHIGFAMDGSNKMMVRLRDDSQASWPQRLKNIFGKRAQRQEKSEVILRRRDILSSNKPLPFCDDVSLAHAALARCLHDYKAPYFFIRAGKSDHQGLILRGMIEPALASRRSRAYVSGAVEAADSINRPFKRLARAAAAQLMNIYHVELRVPSAKEQMTMQVYKRWPRPITTKVETVAFADFMRAPERLIARQIKEAQGLDRPQPLKLMR